MKVFAAGRWLRTSSASLRATLTGFVLFILVGYVSNFAILVWKTGFTTAGVAAYYLGDDSGLRFPKEMHELLENLHFHIYIVPVVLLVLTHLLFMTRWSERAKVAATVFAYAAAALDLGAPWIVWSGGAAFAPIKLFSSAVYHATLVGLALVILWETWLAPLPAAGAPGEQEHGRGPHPQKSA